MPDPGVPEPQSQHLRDLPEQRMGHPAERPARQGLPGPQAAGGAADAQGHRQDAGLAADRAGLPQGAARLAGVAEAYGDQLAHQGFPAAAVITRISFSPDKLFQMKFEGKQVLTDKEAPLVLPLIDDPRTMRITGETPEIREVVTPAPVKQRRRSRSRPA